MTLITSIKQKTFLLIVSALLSVCFFSCSKDSDVTTDNKTLIIGKWSVTHKTLKQIANGATINEEVDANIDGAGYQFNTDNSLTVHTDAEHSFTMQYTLVGDSLTFIHTENQQYYGLKEFFKIKNLTNKAMHLSYLPKDNEPYLTAPNGTYIEMDLTK